MSDGIWNQIQGNWKQFTGNIQDKWGELTGDDIDEINGERKVLEGKIQERYGIAQQEASRQIDEWADEIKDSFN